MKLRKFIVALAITAITAIGGLSLSSTNVQADLIAGSTHWAVDDDVG